MMDPRGITVTFSRHYTQHSTISSLQISSISCHQLSNINSLLCTDISCHQLSSICSLMCALLWKNVIHHVAVRLRRHITRRKPLRPLKPEGGRHQRVSQRASGEKVCWVISRSAVKPVLYSGQFLDLSDPV
ncbi:hypothetical protein FJT64_001471 [Amphibalanus amphitrite]|uniref:Uncharacterized protein n=1 Tax=Amphibalanus amphitrite TaxID=1232801 RepID=A0A6A4UUF6_AMPAM|nr:hypothetical protein FJT64_001471 [Amphibalanus amphitrite]